MKKSILIIIFVVFIALIFFMRMLQLEKKESEEKQKITEEVKEKKYLNQKEITNIFNENISDFDKVKNAYFEINKDFSIDFVEGVPDEQYLLAEVEEVEEIYQTLIKINSLTNCTKVRLLIDKEGRKRFSILIEGGVDKDYLIVYSEEDKYQYGTNLSGYWFVQILGYT